VPESDASADASYDAPCKYYIKANQFFLILLLTKDTGADPLLPLISFSSGTLQLKGMRADTSYKTFKNKKKTKQPPHKTSSNLSLLQPLCNGVVSNNQFVDGKGLARIQSPNNFGESHVEIEHVNHVAQTAVSKRTWLTKQIQLGQTTVRS
jgi:hypothetical protein